ncbi:hypothetical protein JW859_05205 [bacterium]|nr:hypothetical protein [bacterium]
MSEVEKGKLKSAVQQGILNGIAWGLVSIAVMITVMNLVYSPSLGTAVILELSALAVAAMWLSDVAKQAAYMQGRDESGVNNQPGILAWVPLPVAKHFSRRPRR